MRIDQIVQVGVENSLICTMQAKTNLEKILIWSFNWAIWGFWIACIIFPASNLKKCGKYKTSREKRMVIKPPPINTGPEKGIKFVFLWKSNKCVSMLKLFFWIIDFVAATNMHCCLKYIKELLHLIGLLGTHWLTQQMLKQKFAKMAARYMCCVWLWKIWRGKVGPNEPMAPRPHKKIDLNVHIWLSKLYLWQRTAGQICDFPAGWCKLCTRSKDPHLKFHHI